MSSEKFNSDDDQLDALESVSSARAEYWETLRQVERYLSPREIADECDVSIATAYRIVDEFEEAGLVDTQYVIQSDGPTQEYLFINPGEQP